MRQHKQADSGGQADLNPARMVNFNGQIVDRLALVLGNSQKFLPKFILQRDAGAVTVKGEGAFLRPLHHGSRLC